MIIWSTAGHGVFDTATLTRGMLYQLDPHLDRFIAKKLLQMWNEDTMSAQDQLVAVPYDEAS